MIINEAFTLTEHCQLRRHRRSVRAGSLNLVLSHGDVALHAGACCETLRLSRRAAAALVASGEIGADEAARATRLAIVVAANRIVTILRPSRGRRGRGYRRQVATTSVQHGGAR